MEAFIISVFINQILYVLFSNHTVLPNSITAQINITKGIAVSFANFHDPSQTEY